MSDNTVGGMSGTDILNYIAKMSKREAKMAGVDTKEHKFWNTQPTLPANVDLESSGPVENKTLDEVRQTPYNMPAGFEWCLIDVHDSAQIQEMYTLLTENYVEDDDCQFRFDYSIEFLMWALTIPGYLADWHVGVRNTKTGKLMGCITAVPANVQVYDKVVPMVEINFLCVHKKLRDKRLAPVLIKEITRRVNLQNIWQATYTAGIVLPKPVSRCRYYHRSINPKKLIEAKFSYLPPRMTMSSHIKSLRLPATSAHAFRPLKLEDVPKARNLLQSYLESHAKLFVHFNEDEFAHLFLPRVGVINTYVLEDADGNITDMCSFYHLPSSIFGNELHSKLFAVFSYYNVATTMPLVDLMRDALVFARDLEVDVFNALDVMENSQFVEELKFGVGDGFLQYYLYNWQCPEMRPQDIGLVLV